MILHLLRMRRNANRNVFNDRKNVSVTPFVVGVTARVQSPYENFQILTGMTKQHVCCVYFNIMSSTVHIFD